MASSKKAAMMLNKYASTYADAKRTAVMTIDDVMTGGSRYRKYENSNKQAT